MSSDRTAVETNTVTEPTQAKEQLGRLLTDTPVDRNGERIDIARAKPNTKAFQKAGKPYHRAGSERLLEILKQYCWR
jgi:hypothetical protein